MIKLVALFFTFGASVCGLTIVLLLFPDTPLDSLWRLNPEAQAAFHSLGRAAGVLMLTVGIACAVAARGLWQGSPWGVRVATIILWLNIGGDLLNAVMRHDFRSLIGLPIAGAMIFYLARYRKADSSLSK